MKDAAPFIERHALAYRLIVLAASGVATFALALGFQTLHVLGGIVQPAVALGPALGLFFGWPAIVGCALGMTAPGVMAGASVGLLAQRLAVYLVCSALPYIIWYLVMRKSEKPYPRFDTTGKATLALILFVAEAATLTALTIPLDSALSTVDDGVLLHFLNSCLFLVYLGFPPLIFFERWGLYPLPPWFIKVPYECSHQVNLTQRVLAGFLLSAGVAIAVFMVFTCTPYFYEVSGDTQALEDNIAAAYVFTVALTALFFVPMLFVVRTLERQFTKPVEVLTQASREFVNLMASHRDDPEAALAASDVDLHGIKPKHEMADLINSTNAMRHDLVRYVDQLGHAVAERERTTTELAIASRIQVDAVPRDFSALREQQLLDIAAVLKPARAVGGDFYDAFGLSDHEVGMVIADVSDKGMPAALFMMRAMAEIREKMRSCDTVGEALTQANQSLCERNDTMLFVTVFACTLDVSTGLLSYANAGHNSPWIVRDGKGEWLQFVKPQLVMGALAITRYKTNTLRLFPGDSLVLYTDGVTEAANPASELLGATGLENAIAEHPEATSVERVKSVLASVEAFANGAPQSDDITILSMIWDVPVHTLEVPPSLDALDRVVGFIRSLCQEDGCTPKMAYDTCLAVEEAFVNIAKHGFPAGTPVRPVRMTAAVDTKARRLHLRISDAGVPYDPLAYVSERVDAARGADNKVGGLGILLVRSIVDDMAYERVEDRNVLRLAKEFV